MSVLTVDHSLVGLINVLEALGPEMVHESRDICATDDPPWLLLGDRDGRFVSGSSRPQQRWYLPPPLVLGGAGRHTSLGLDVPPQRRRSAPGNGPHPLSAEHARRGGGRGGIAMEVVPHGGRSNSAPASRRPQPDAAGGRRLAGGCCCCAGVGEGLMGVSLHFT